MRKRSVRNVGFACAIVLASEAIIGLTRSATAGQNRGGSLREAFEVVSIRPTSTPQLDGARGGGGGGQAGRIRNPRGYNPCSVIVEPQIDPRLFDASNATVIQFIGWAYDLPCVGDDGSYFFSECRIG
jgi:hypothetical protein